MGRQSGKGFPATPDIAIPYLDDGFNTAQQSNSLKSGGDNEYLISNMKMEHREKFGYTVFARPNMCNYLSAYMLGTDVITGTADPYTHTITRGDRDWLTVERQLSSTVYQRLVDCKLENMTISGEAGQPVKITVEGEALTATLRTTGQTLSYDDSDKTFMFYDGSSRFKIDTTNSAMIKGFEVKVNVNSGGGLRDDRFSIIDLPDYNYSVDCTLELYTSNLTRFKKITYNASTVPQADFSTGAVEIDCQYVLTSTRQLKITVPTLIWESIGGIALNPDGATMSESIAGPATKQATTDLMTMVIMNTANTDGIEDNLDIFITDNDDKIIKGVY